MDSGGRVTKELADCMKDTSSGITVVTVGGGNRHIEGTLKGPSGTPYEGGVFRVDIVIPGDLSIPLVRPFFQKCCQFSIDGYPFEPPKMKFVTKIWHPNVSSQTGAICLVSGHRPIFMDFYLQFFHSSGYSKRSVEPGTHHQNGSTIGRSIILSKSHYAHMNSALNLVDKYLLRQLQALMCAPEPNDPQDAEVATMFKGSPATFQQTAKFWTEMYAVIKDDGAEAREASVANVVAMGFSDSAARKALSDNGWDESAAVNALLSS